jgi:hypothetical protein
MSAMNHAHPHVRWSELALAIFLPLSLCCYAQGAACQCPQATFHDLLELATYVFTAQVSELRVDKKTSEKTIIFDLTDSFKGNPDSEMEINPTSVGTNCDIDYKEGDTYLVFVRWQWGSYLTARCWGTKPIPEAGKELSALGPGVIWKERFYGQLSKNCMGRPDTPCCLSSVRAMKDGGFLPEPEAGCTEGMIPDRLKCEGSWLWCIPIVGEHRHQEQNR